jgi:hypothetical protein
MIESSVVDLEKSLKEQFQRNRVLVGKTVASHKQELEKLLNTSLFEVQKRRSQNLLERVQALAKRLENLKIIASLTTRQALGADAVSRLGLATAPNAAQHLTAAGILGSVREQGPAGGPGR